MKLYIDTDAIAKLAAWDLAEIGVRAIGSGVEHVYQLPTAKYQLGVMKRRERGQQKYGIAGHARICEFVDAVNDAPEDCHLEDNFLIEVDDIDAGEAILFSRASRDEESRLLTGDKRSIRAVATSPGCAALVDRLAGRVLCIEQVLLRAIDSLGFEAVKDRVVGALTVDGAVRAAFGSGPLAEESNVVFALTEQVRHLREASGALLDA